LDIRQKLADANRTVTRFQSVLALAYGANFDCLLSMGKSVEAVEVVRKASDIMQKLVAEQPTQTEFQDVLAQSQIDIGRALVRQNRFAEAFTALDKGLVIRQNLANADPTNALYSAKIADNHMTRGGARARAGQPAKAAADLRRALELWGKVPHLDPSMLVARSHAQALLAGLGRDAKSGVTKDEARTFADQAVAALADAVKTGWAQPSELKEPDFDALRGQDDFRKLVAEVEAKSRPKAEPRD
jgi:tetratricopeptide (TPR) repeat protein